MPEDESNLDSKECEERAFANDLTSAIRIAIEKDKENVKSFIKARGFAKQLSKNPLPGNRRSTK